MDNVIIDQLTQKQSKDIKAWRRYLHSIPEVGFMEVQTTAFVVEKLSKLDCTIFIGEEALVREKRKGVPPEEEIASYIATCDTIPPSLLQQMAGGMTGCVAVFDSGKKGAHTVLRFDIDALPIQETQSTLHEPVKHQFASTRKGVMHACGHDGHAAIGLGVAHLIHELLPSMTGKVTLLFQPAEEGGRGAEAMVAKGWLDDADYFLSGHVGFIEQPVGTVALMTSQFLATTKLDVTYQGVASHAGQAPEEGKSALLSAASAALHLHSIARHSAGKTRINVGYLQGGSGRNIIPNEAEMLIETRGETTELNEYMKQEAVRILQASATLYDTTVNIRETGEAASGKCDTEWLRWGKRALQTSAFVHTMIEEVGLGASEDATAFLNEIQRLGGKGTYLIFASPLAGKHHQPNFDYNEDVLPVAVSTFMRLISYHHSR